jgi:hypothetical protein
MDGAITPRARAQVRDDACGMRRAYRRCMRMITRMLLASVLAIGAGSFAGCGDTDCPSTAAAASSCSGEGLSCSYGSTETCTCRSGSWSCVESDDAHFPMPRDMSMRDLAPAID